MNIEEVSRGIFEAIRKRVVEVGYLPDIRMYNTAEDYQQAKDNLKQTVSGGKLIEVFSVGTPYDRGGVEYHRITINKKNTNRGSVGTFGVQYHEKIESENKFKKYKYPSTNKNISYEIRTITNSIKYSRILNSIVENSIIDGGVVKGILPDFSEDKDILMMFDGQVDLPSITDSIECIHNYTATDVWIGQPLLTNDNIVPLTTINFTPIIK